MRKLLRTLIMLTFIAVILISLNNSHGNKLKYHISTYIKYMLSFRKVNVPDNYQQTDRNKNGIPDPIDLVNEARKEVERKTPYKDAYYANGYPPDTEGVCTDVIWRAFKGINVDFKRLVDKDIKQNTSLYWRIKGKPDPNIDFRRVPNLDVFLKKHADSLTKEIKPGDIENLGQWQPGDILVILKPYQHIAIISDKRSRDGIPYIIHNTYPHAVETSHFNLSDIEISGHYRWKY